MGQGRHCLLMAPLIPRKLSCTSGIWLSRLMPTFEKPASFRLRALSRSIRYPLLFIETRRPAPKRMQQSPEDRYAEGAPPSEIDRQNPCLNDLFNAGKQRCCVELLRRVCSAVTVPALEIADIRYRPVDGERGLQEINCLHSG